MKYILTVLILYVCFNSNASHITAGEMYYDYLGNNDYRINVLLYRDCSGLEFDDSLRLTVFDQVNNVIQQVSMPFDSTTVQYVDYSTLSNSSCLMQFPGACLEYYTYSAIVNLSPLNGGYLLSYQRCCLTSLITNIDIPDDYGYTFTCKIPGLETGYYENSSPRFQGHSLFLGCTNELINFNHAAIDPDGDQILYSLVTPQAYDVFAGLGPDPNPEGIPPYFSLAYASGFSIQDPLGLGGILSINSLTGLMTVQPVFVGHFAICIRADEYKSGTLINSTYRNLDMLVGIGSVGIEENTPDQFLVFYNAITNQVSVNSKEEHSLMILTADGKQVLRHAQNNDESYTIDFSNLESGIYYFQFHSSSGRIVKTIYK